ncbi:hypothetical protein [Flavobacterium adhaerens]|uniref:hypothetical protein n=1 Tax=Flavobacterium adhaerens TaxID=3149043 RepID=UPI0032B3ACA8
MKPFKLDDTTKIESGFKIPENYFENFQATLIEKTSKPQAPTEIKIVSLFRKRKKVLMAIAAVFTIALMIPITYRSITKNNELDTTSIENYLSAEGQLNQYELYGEIEPEKGIQILEIKEIETQTLEDMLVSNPNIENLVIENQK